MWDSYSGSINTRTKTHTHARRLSVRVRPLAPRQAQQSVGNAFNDWVYIHTLGRATHHDVRYFRFCLCKFILRRCGITSAQNQAGPAPQPPHSLASRWALPMGALGGPRKGGPRHPEAVVRQNLRQNLRQASMTGDVLDSLAQPLANPLSSVSMADLSKADLAKLKEIKELLDADIFTQDEFARQKKKIIEGRPEVQPVQEVVAVAFIPSGTFQGAKAGYTFKVGAQGPGYYLEQGAAGAAVVPQGQIPRPDPNFIPPEMSGITAQIASACTCLLILSILNIGNLFLSIPGLAAACPFACNGAGAGSRGVLLTNVRSVKGAAQWCVGAAIFFSLGCIGGSISIWASPCYYVWWTPSWGCNDGLAGMWFGYFLAILLPTAIVSNQLAKHATKAENLLVQPADARV